jgi:YD repeat-containing protein
MMPAAKHGDPQLGVDIHLCIVPPGTPVPLPTPHISVVFDPFDYIPFIGATTTVMGMKRANAGTSGIVVHIPPGFPFAKPPEKDDELFMGSATVLVDGEPFSHIAHPALGCQVVGMPSPGRIKSKPKKMCLLPTDFNLAIPATVLIGGPPTISMMGLASKGVFKTLGALAKKAGPLLGKVAKRFKDWRKAKFGHLPPGFLKCVILRAEPVDILTGTVSVEQEDFELPGRMPFQWLRSYSSGSARGGICGIGWETPLDGRLEVDAASGIVALHYPGAGPLYFDRLPQSAGEAGAELELMDGALLADGGSHFAVRTKGNLIYSFPKAGVVVRPDGTRELPLERITDLSGNVMRFERHGGQPTAIVVPGGRRLELRVEDGLLREISMMRADTRVRHSLVRYEYGAGDLVAVIDALGKAYRFDYAAHRMVRHTDRNGLSFHYSYEAHGDGWRVDHAWGDGGLYDYRFAYFDAIHERRITDSLGHVSVVKLDETGLPINELDPLGGMTIFEYDDCGRTSAVVDPAGRRTEYAYDARGNLLTLTRPDGSTVETVFDAANKAIRITDPNGAVWQQAWDGRGQLLTQTTPLGHLSRYEYDGLGQLTAHINPRGARTVLAYDGDGNLAQLDNALGQRTRFAFDGLGNLTARSDPAGQPTRYQYDAKSRLTAVVLPSGASIHCAYDAEDNLSAYKDENGAVTRLEYFGQGEIARRIQPDGHRVEYLYDTEERLVGVRNQRGELYQIRRDALGRVVEEVDYWGQSNRYAYDAAGKLKATLDPLGQRIDFVTDPLGRIVKKILPSPEQPEGGAPWIETFDYDPNGNLIATGNAHVEVTREFDAEGLLLKEIQQHASGDCFIIESAYDEAGNRIVHQTRFAGGGSQPGASAHRVEFAYNLLDRFIEARLDGGKPIRLTHDALGQLTREEFAPGLARELSYNADGLLTRQHTHMGKQTLFATDYHYDPVGNLTRREDSGFGVDTYLYDPMGRILAHTDPQGRIQRFLNDPAGDRLAARVATSQAGNDAAWERSGEHEGTRYRFNRAGNLVHRQDADGLLELEWDANQRLIASRRSGTNGQRLTTRYAYDPLGRRLWKETAGVRTTFGWDGDALALDATLGAVREFVYRPNTFEPLALLRNANAPPFTTSMTPTAARSA